MTPDEIAQEHLDRGIEHHEAKRYGEAEAEYRKGLELTPNDPYLHHNLGSALWTMGNTDAGIEHYREAVRLGADFFAPHCDLALAVAIRVRKHPTLEGWREVRTLALSALAIGPRDRSLLYDLALAEWFLNNRSGAIRLFREIVSQDENDLEALNLLARALQRTWQWREMFKTSVKLCTHPDFNGSDLDRRNIRAALKSAAIGLSGLAIYICWKLRRR